MTRLRHRPPTEEDVRAHLARAWTAHHANGWPEDEWETAWSSFEGMAATIYDLDDIRESELDRLDQLTRAAIRPLRDEARRLATEALVDALAAFAAEHPDAPRANRELTA